MIKLNEYYYHTFHGKVKVIEIVNANCSMVRLENGKHRAVANMFLSKQLAINTPGCECPEDSNIPNIAARVNSERRQLRGDWHDSAMFFGTLLEKSTNYVKVDTAYDNSDTDN